MPVVDARRRRTGPGGGRTDGEASCQLQEVTSSHCGLMLGAAGAGDAAANWLVSRLFSQYKLMFERRLGFNAVAGVGCDRKASSRKTAEMEGTATR